MRIDMDDLRRDLEDYYGTAAFSGMPVAFMDLYRVQQASDYELLRMAQQNGFDMSRYSRYDDDPFSFWP